MIRRFAVVPLFILVLLCMCFVVPARGEEVKAGSDPSVVTLPAPTMETTVTVEQALQRRRSVRTYANEPLTLKQVSQLLWAAQGITDAATGHRTAPSAMAMYPLCVYLVAANVTGLAAGVYRYIPQGHKLELVKPGDQRENVGGQNQMRTAPALLVYAADLSAMKQRGGGNAERWADIEIGHSAENVLLEEVALGLVGVPMGGIDGQKFKSAMQLPESETPIYAVSAGRKG